MKAVSRSSALWILIITALGFVPSPPAFAQRQSRDVVPLDEAIREKCLSVLRQGLRSEEFWPSIHAAEALTLAGQGDEVTAFLEPLLDGSYDDQQRCGLARELVRAGKRDAADILFQILSGKEAFGHVHAAESLFKVGELGDVKAPRKAFEQNENPRLKLMAAAALGKAGNPRALEHVREMIADADPELARTAAWILARIGSPADIPALKDGLQKMKDDFSKSYFEHALANLGDPEGQKALARNLNSNDPAVRTYAATFAGDARLVSAVPRLKELLEDENLDVRVRAAQTLLVLARPAPDPKSLAVLPDARDSVYQSLVEQARAAFAKRRKEFEQLNSVEDCKAWQKARREFFIEQLGGFPEKTPLNAKVVGELDGGDYRIEKVIYESRPHHHVTATVYLPKTNGPYPGVVIACGHTKSGKAADYNQKIGILLAKNGMAAMCYDPIGQGERSQILDEQGKGTHGATTEHFLVGVGSILTGTNTAQYRIWDGIRGIDYLTERSDIIPEKIGMTGCSGGGTLTSYIMALDDRVTCAAPACYITTLERLIETIGPQDAEQNIHAQIAFGMEQTDYILMRAPKPTLICSTTEDFFDIQGSWDSLRQAKRFYGLLSQPEQVDLVETPGKHGVTQTGREAIVRWMQRWLLGIDKDITDPGGKVWSEKDLQCTPKGQVLLLEGEKSVFDLNVERAKSFEANHKKFAELPAEEAQAVVRKIAGIRKFDDIPPATLRTVGTASVGGYQIRKLAMYVEDGVAIPILRIIPNKPVGERWLYFSDEGKQACLEHATVKEVLQQGHEVWAMDLRGTGELRNRSSSKMLGDWKTATLAYLLDQSLIGQRCEDILNCVRMMRSIDGENAKPIHLASHGPNLITYFYLQAVEPHLIGKTSVVKFEIEGWQGKISDPETNYPLSDTVHGALMHFDIDDLLNLVGRSKRARE